ADSAPRERVLTIDEARALFAAARHPHEILYLLLAFGTGARPKALLELTTFQINLANRLIYLNPSGRRQNKKRRPTLPICDTLLPVLQELETGAVIAYAGKPLRSIRFGRLRMRAACLIRSEAARQASTFRRAGNRDGARVAIENGRARA